ncbi:MAG: hypothetical protein IKQ39_01095 [Oscillospiraceae bacterium]|nr:hypothetical protein [Oscillospiraceae bacterium]
MKHHIFTAAAVMLLLTGCADTAAHSSETPAEYSAAALPAADRPAPDTALYSAAKPGDTVSFGGYDWYITGRSENTVELLCKTTVCVMPYHNEKGDITWENCSLRQYLNTEFYLSFTDAERALIVQTHCENPDNTEFGSATPGGNATDDYVYLPSMEEARALPEALRVCDRYWWLRSPGKHRYYAAGVYSSGVIDPLGYYTDYADYESAVRPALRLMLADTE